MFGCELLVAGRQRESLCRLDKAPDAFRIFFDIHDVSFAFRPIKRHQKMYGDEAPTLGGLLSKTAYGTMAGFRQGLQTLEEPNKNGAETAPFLT